MTTTTANVDSISPLTPTQEGILYHSLLAAPAAGMYVQQYVCKLSGPLDLPRFQEAWHATVGRHSVLRTLIAWEGRKKPLQIVRGQVEPEWLVEDLRAISAEQQQERLDAFLNGDRSRGFQFDQAPLMRFALFRIDDEAYRFVWSHHHIILDGWSLGLVLGEVFRSYQSLRAVGRQPDLTPAPRFEAFVQWLAGEDAAQTRDYWTSLLDGFSRPTRLRLPETTAGTAWADHQAEVTGRLPAAATVRLTDFARRHGLTLNAVVRGAWALVLSRYSGEKDVVFGATSSGRPPFLEGALETVGLFINTLPVRVKVEPDRILLDWLQEIQRQQVETSRYEWTPLSEVQAWSGVPQGEPLFQSLLVFENLPGPSLSPNHLELSDELYLQRSNYPLAVLVTPGEELGLLVLYDDDRFGADPIRRMVDQLVFVLGSLVDNPTQPVGAVGIFPPSELTQILSNWNETAAEYSSDHTIHGLIDERARQTPEATAVVGSGMSLSYRLLLERADSVAVRLQNLGVGPDRPVGIRLERSAGMVVAMLGVLKAGGAYVPLDPRLPEGRLQFILDETGAAALIVAVDSAAGLASPALQSLPLLQISDAGELSEPDIEGRLQTEEAVSPENLAYVMYTSGSTGRPKGVAVTHRNLVHSTLARVAYYQQSPRSYLLLSPFTFDSSVAGIFWTLTQGGTLVLPGPQMEQDIDHLGLLIDTHRVSHLLALPAVYSLILEQVPMERLRSLETVIVAGEPCQPTLARQHFKRASGARLYNEYGPTEATVWCTVEGVKPIKSGASVLSERVPIGRPISNTKAYILDESLRPVPVGVVGELCIGGDGLARGYLRQPELTMEKFVDRDLTGTGPSRIYRTGDLARFLPDGTIDLVGRLDHQVKVRGRRIELDEIVKIMIEHPDIVSAAATVKQMSPGNDEIVGYYVAGEGRSPSLSDLRAHLRDRLPEYMVPSHFVGLDALPTMENGKLDRLALPDPDGRSRPATGFHAPRTWAELLVTEACAELLGVPDVGIDDNFFDLGGHSLLSMQFISKLAAATGVRVSPTVILLNTLGYAAALIQESTPPEKAPSFSTSSAQSAGLPATNTPLATPFFFGSAGERIFGMHYAPTASATGRAILVCPPVGWEYYRTHWALRKLARLLASRGHHVLRFDYSGVGDSWGSPHTASLHRWVADVRTAAVELAAISSSDGLSVIGLRLGATLSVLATEGGLAAERLVMWDPVLNGRQHLATLQGMHDEMFSRKKVGRVRPGDARDELLGFPYSDALRTELGSIDLSATSWTGPDAVLVASQPRPEYQDLLTVAHGSVRLDVIDDAGIWDDAGAVHSALLPARIPAHIAALVGDPA